MVNVAVSILDSFYNLFVALWDSVVFQAFIIMFTSVGIVGIFSSLILNFKRKE